MKGYEQRLENHKNRIESFKNFVEHLDVIQEKIDDDKDLSRLQKKYDLYLWHSGGGCLHYGYKDKKRNIDFLISNSDEYQLDEIKPNSRLYFEGWSDKDDINVYSFIDTFENGLKRLFSDEKIDFDLHEM